MKTHQRFLYWLRGVVSGLAHQPWVSEHWHDRLEYVAYRIIDPLVWRYRL